MLTSSVAQNVQLATYTISERNIRFFFSAEQSTFTLFKSILAISLCEIRSCKPLQNKLIGKKNMSLCLSFFICSNAFKRTLKCHFPSGSR